MFVLFMILGEKECFSRGGMVCPCVNFVGFRSKFLYFRGEKKGKAILLQAWSGPESCRKLRFPDFMTVAHDGGKVVSPTHRLPLPPGSAPGTHFC